MADPVFKFERNAPKGKCPSCGANNKFRYYEGFHGDDRYGKCERLNECGFFAAPSAKDHPDYKPKKKEKNIEKSILFLDKKECDTVIENQDSNFHKFCLAAGISSEHLKKWLVGSDKNGNTVFFFKNRDGKFVNKKTGKYKEDGHRQKADGQEGFYSLPQPKDFKSKYVLCLFGEHILGKEKKPVCIVESEKTAIIASWHYPEYDWVSCGANTGLSDGTDDTNNKIGPLLGKEVWWLCDSDKAGRDNSSIRNIQKWFLEYKIIDLFKDRTDGWDIADEIISGKKPIIMPDKFNTVNVPLLPEKTGNWVYVPNNTRAAEKIDTLCILVGERQANVADHYGLRCVGIENLHGFLEKKLGENFHKTIQDLIGNKGVQRIVLVSNSDILHINYDPENTDKELGDKLMYNYKAIEKFKPCTINYDDIEFVFAHLASDLKNTAITLEELLNKMPDKRAEIIMELDRESEDHTWFHGFNICKYQLRKVREYFLIDYDQNIPKTFYRVFEDTLRESRWTLEGSTWQFSPMF